MSNSSKIRRDVAEDYAKAVTAPSGCCCGDPVPKGVVVKIAGYTDAEIGSLPAEAVVNSFGCGNPLAFSSVEPGQVVLDLGSGAGIDLLLAAKKVGKEGKVIGVDMTDEMIDKARENITAAGLTNVEVRKGIIEALPVDDDSVDWVISNCVINLSPEKHRVFQEIARVLKPGGAMLVSDIVAEDLPKSLTENRQVYSACLAGAISEPAYLKGLTDAGLVDVAVKDRLVYDESQLVGLIGSELREVGSACCSGSDVNQELARRFAKELAGKVASVKVFGKKPV
ncbi:MAG: arsenite methyltransferase [Myxococcota bacterium]|nr:arsenite methyltransferase [Myxococcota bacterium]